MMILSTKDIRVHSRVTIEIDGESYSGKCIATDSNRIDAAFIQWEDGSIGRITDSFLSECNRLAIDFARVS